MTCGMNIFRTTMFEKSVRKLGATEAELAALEAEIAENPEAGTLSKVCEGFERFGSP